MFKSETGKPFSRNIMYAKVTSKSGTAPTAYFKSVYVKHVSVVEDKYHVLLQCPLYADFRIRFLDNIHALCTCNEFLQLRQEQQFLSLMTSPRFTNQLQMFCYAFLINTATYCKIINILLIH